MTGAVLLELRDRWWGREETWNTLARRDHLWKAIKEVVQQRSLLLQLVQLVNSGGFIAEKDVPYVKTLLWTAWYLQDLRRLSNFTLEEFTRTARALTICSIFNHSRNGDFQAAVGDIEFRWARDCLRALTNESVISKAIVPIALVGTDRLAFLSLEVLNGGADQLQHPSDELYTQRDRSFRDSMGKAWRVACSYLEIGEDLQGRWRIIDETGAPIPEVIGDSAGGASMFGWLAALQNKAYDPAVIVLGAIRDSNEEGLIPPLKGVNGIEEKLNSIIGNPLVDTIVTSSEVQVRIEQCVEQEGFSLERVKLPGNELVLIVTNGTRQLRIRFR
jgi:hypothetical protein